MTQLVGWTFAGLPLVCEPSQRPNSGFWFETYADGWDLGEPAAQIVTRESLLLDGDDVLIDRYGNRQMGSTVVVCGYTNADLFAGARQLSFRIGQRSSLTWTPPQSGPPSVYDVRTSEMRFVGSDLEFVKPEGNMRTAAFAVTWHAAPWAYEAEVVEETFAPGAGTVTLVDGCTANTNWPGMTTATYLGASVVRKSETGSSTWHPTHPHSGPGGGAGGYSVTGGASLTVNYTGSVPAVTYVYLDVVLQSGSAGDAGSFMNMRNTSTGSPIGAQAQASGFTRYFWTRPTTGLVVLDVEVPGAGSGTTVTINIDQFGTSTTLPSGSLLALNMRGSVRVYGQLVAKGTHTDGNAEPLGETFIYCDPTMLTYGWQPDLGESYANAPEGAYWLWIQPGLNPSAAAYSVGDVFAFTIAGQTCSTQTTWAGNSTVTNGRWFPIGPFYLGTNRTRRLGAITNLDDTIQTGLTINGAAMTASSKARLIRADPETALVHVMLPRNGLAGDHQYLFVDPPTFDQPRPGIYAGDLADGTDAVSVLELADGWNWPVLQPPTPCLWTQTQSADTVTVTLRSRPAHHTFVTDQVA